LMFYEKQIFRSITSSKTATFFHYCELVLGNLLENRFSLSKNKKQANGGACKKNDMYVSCFFSG